MGAAIGLLSGVGLGLLTSHMHEQHQEKLQHQQMWDQQLNQIFTNGDPQIAKQLAHTPQGQKEIKRMHGEGADLYTQFVDMRADHAMQFSQEMGGGGAGGQPQQGGGQPMDLDKINAHIQRLEGLKQKYVNEPDKIKHIDDTLKDLDRDRSAAMAQANQRRMGEQFQQSQQSMNEFRAATLAMRADQQKFEDWYKTQTLEEKKAKDTEASQQKTETQFNAHATTLATRKIALMNSLQTKLAAESLDAKQAKPMVDAFNRNVDQMDKAAKKLGVDFNAEDYRLSLKEGKPSYFLGIGGTKPSVEEGGGAPITATNEKGEKIQWDGKAWVPVK